MADAGPVFDQVNLVVKDMDALAIPDDAFWDSRFAIVGDPDGNDVGLMSPMDPAKRFTPAST